MSSRNLESKSNDALMALLATGLLAGGILLQRTRTSEPVPAREPVTPPAIGRPTVYHPNQEIDWLVRAMWAEGRGNDTGPSLIAATILNRVRDSRWPDTVSGVVTQPYQFSSYNAGDPNRYIYSRPLTELAAQGGSRWEEYYALAERAIDEYPDTLIPNCYHFANVVTALGARRHTIRTGETYGHLAIQYNTSVASLVMANGYLPEELQLGQELRVPSVVLCPAHLTALSHPTPGTSWMQGMRVVPQSVGLLHWFFADAPVCNCLQRYKERTHDDGALAWWYRQRLLMPDLAL